LIDTGVLRKKILDLAICGKLSVQNMEFESAENDFMELDLVKKELLNCKIIKNEKIAEGENRDIPFKIPENWRWCQLADLCKTVTDGTHKTPTYIEQGIPFLSVKNISSGTFDFKNVKYISEQEHEELLKRCNPELGDVLFCRIGTLGKAIEIDFEPSFSIFVSLGLIKPLNPYLSKYLVNVFNSGYGERWIEKNKAGDSMHAAKINLDELRTFMVPLPPHEEQARIVEKLKGLFALLDEIDNLQEAYGFDIEILRSKLIDAGIQGKLTVQRPEDGTAEALYEDIQKEKARLIKEKKIKKEKDLAKISEEEILFEVPNNWKWVRWGDLSQSIQYGYNAPAKQDGRIKMVRISDIQDGKVLWDTVPYCDIDECAIESYLLHENDILFARTGGTVGKSYIVTDIPEEAVYAGYLIRTSYSSKLCAKYMKYFMESRLYWRQLQDGTIATAQPNCNGQTLSKMVVPLPPYAEQVRIVEKLENLLKLV